MMNNKAQQSRNDLVVWYVACLAVVLVTLGSLYGIGIIGNYEDHGSLLDSNKVTTAAVAIPMEEPVEDNLLIIENSSLEDAP